MTINKPYVSEAGCIDSAPAVDAYGQIVRVAGTVTVVPGPGAPLPVMLYDQVTGLYLAVAPNVAITANTPGLLVLGEDPTGKAQYLNILADGTLYVTATSWPLPTGAAQEHVTAISPHAARLTDGAAFYKATTPLDTQPISATALPLPTGAAQEHVTAISPHAVRLTDGAAFYKATTPLDTQPISAVSLPLPTGAAQEHVTAISPHAVRLTDGAAFYKATTPTDTQPISAVSLPLPTGAAQEHVTAISPHAVRLTDGAAFYKATTPTDTQPISAVALPLPAGAATEATLLLVAREHITAVSPHAVRITDGTAFYSSVTAAGASNFPTAMVQRMFPSINNSSNVNIGAGAWFTGAGDLTYGMSAIQVTFKADQNCYVYVEQSLNNINWDLSDNYLVTAGIGDGRTFQISADYVRVRVYNMGGVATTYVRLGTALCTMIEPIPRALLSIGYPTEVQYLASGVVQHVKMSSVNSTATNLVAGGTFTGTSDGLLGVAAISVNFKADQTCRVTVQQSYDRSTWDVTDSFVVYTGVAAGRTFQAVGGYVRVVVNNLNGAAGTTYIRLITYLRPICNALARAPSHLGAQLVSIRENQLHADANGDRLYSSVYDDHVDDANENGFLLFRNPAANTKDMTVNRIIADMTTKGDQVTVRVYHTPTVGAAGAALAATPRRIRTLPASTAATITPFSLPTCAPFGTHITTFSCGANSNSVFDDEQGGLVLGPGLDLLITVQTTAATKNVAITVIWTEN